MSSAQETPSLVWQEDGNTLMLVRPAPENASCDHQLAAPGPRPASSMRLQARMHSTGLYSRLASVRVSSLTGYAAGPEKWLRQLAQDLARLASWPQSCSTVYACRPRVDVYMHAQAAACTEWAKSVS